MNKSFEMEAHFWAIDTAEQGDFRLLARLVRDGFELSSRQRKLVADILEGKLKRRAGKPVDLRVLCSRYVRIGDHVLDLQQTGLKRKAAVSLAAEEFKTSERTVRTALKYVLDDLAEGVRLSREN
jgi:hypothetical protein